VFGNGPASARRRGFVWIRFGGGLFCCEANLSLSISATTEQWLYGRYGVFDAITGTLLMKRLFNPRELRNVCIALTAASIS